MACFAHLGVKILTIQGFMGQLPKERARDREIDQCWRLRAGAFCHRPEHWLKGYASASGAKPGGGPRPWQVLERHHHRDRRHAKFSRCLAALPAASCGTPFVGVAFGSLLGSHAPVFAIVKLILLAVVPLRACCDGCIRFLPGLLHGHVPFCVRLCVCTGDGPRAAGRVLGADRVGASCVDRNACLSGWESLI